MSSGNHREIVIPKCSISTSDEVEPYIREYITPRMKDDWNSLTKLSYVGGMAHMLQMLCKTDSPAWRRLVGVKGEISIRMSELLRQYNSEIVKKEG
jgi:predicted secreted protein